jgi:hypothetical protein
MRMDMRLQIVDPKVFNTFRINEYINFEWDNTTKNEQFYNTTLKNDSMELIFELSPLPFDFYEPQEFGRYVFIPEELLP